ncbi:MAG: NAD(P)-binding domain-containing protein [Devosia sp.]
MERIGLLGAGHLARFLVDGFLRAGVPPEGLAVTRRGQGEAIGKARGVAVCQDAEALARAAPIIILSVRPMDAAATLGEAGVGPHHTVISVCAGVPLDRLATVAPKATLVRAMPISAASLGASPTPLFPDNQIAHTVLSLLGPVIPVEGEAELQAASASAAVYGLIHDLIGATADDLARAGVHGEGARRLAADTFAAAAAMVNASPQTKVSAMVDALATPGGVTGACLEAFRAAGGEAAWRAAHDAAQARLNRLSD